MPIDRKRVLAAAAVTLWTLGLLLLALFLGDLGRSLAIVAVGAAVGVLGILALAGALAARRATTRAGKAAKEAARTRQAVAEQLQAVHVAIGEVRTELRALEARDKGMLAAVRGIERRVDGLAQLEALVRDDHQLLERVEPVVASLQGGPGARPSGVYRQLEALIGVYHDLELPAALPRSGGWAAAPDLLLELIRLVRAERPHHVLECGSGVSTIVLAAALRQNGAGRLTSLEHHGRFASRTASWLEEQHLSSLAEVLHAPLEPLDGYDGAPWYASSSVPPGPFDLVFIDGPPAGRHPRARGAAMHLLRQRLAPGAVVVLDDYLREDEHALADEWVATYGFELEELDVERGAALLRLPVDAPSEPAREDDVEGAEEDLQVEDR